MSYLLIASVSLFVCMALVPLLIKLAPTVGMLDQPASRKVHENPIPRVGGIGLVVGSLCAVLIWLPLDKVIQSYLLGSLVLLFFGSWDDMKEIGHYWKFLGQFIATAIVVFYGGVKVSLLPFTGLATIPDFIAIPFTFIAMVGMINAINHSDGLDGLAGGESLLSLLAIAFLAHLAGGDYEIIIAIAVVGGIVGFLRFNTHPARVFMGDSGSQFLGFTLGLLAIVLTQQTDPAISKAIPALLLGLPVIDIIIVFALRIKSGVNWFEATRNHLHHRLLELGFLHHEAVVIIYAIHGFYVVCGVLLCYETDFMIVALYLSVAVTVFSIVTMAERSGWHAHTHTKDSFLFRYTVEKIRRHKIPSKAPIIVLSWIVPIAMIGFSFLTTSVPRDFAMASAILVIVMILLYALYKVDSLIVRRGVIYVAVTFLVYLMVKEPPTWLTNAPKLDTIFFTSIAITVALAIRFSTKAFRITPMDYLIMLAILGISLSRGLTDTDIDANGILIKVIIMIYASELLITIRPNKSYGLNIAALISLGVLSIRGLF